MEITSIIKLDGQLCEIGFGLSINETKASPQLHQFPLIWGSKT